MNRHFLSKSKRALLNLFNKIYFWGTDYEKLNFGSGKQIIPGWLNIDFDPKFAPEAVQIDLQKPLPFPNNSVSMIFSEHTIEHFDKAHGLALLKECYRVLKPGGVIRFGWPNFNKIVEAFLKKDQNYWNEMQKHMGPNFTNTYEEFISDCLYSWDHKYMYTPKLLKKYFQLAGFVKISNSIFGKSKLGFKQDTRDDVDTAYIEAKKI